MRSKYKTNNVTVRSTLQIYLFVQVSSLHHVAGQHDSGEVLLPDVMLLVSGPGFISVNPVVTLMWEAQPVA